MLGLLFLEYRIIVEAAKYIWGDVETVVVCLLLQLEDHYKMWLSPCSPRYEHFIAM